MNELVLAFGSPWSVAMEHFVENETQGPNVALGSVRLIFKDLQRHVKRSADHRLDLHIMRDLLRKPKITNLQYVILDHDIGGFQISMNDTFSDQG